MESTLHVWDTHLADAGGDLLQARLTTLADLAPHVHKAYAEIAPTNNDATAEYKASIDVSALTAGHGAARADLAQAMLHAMSELRSEEIARGLSLVGPHRDDITLTLGMLPARATPAMANRGRSHWR